jgi:ATP-dependent exoDNAse (exonuclease V) alpha subunit
MNFSPDQQEAIDNIRGLFNGSHREQVLTGGPGTGKSFLTATIIDEAEEAGFDVLVAATTHPAVSVVQNFTNYPAFTFHKMFDLKVEEDYQTNTTSIYQAVGKDGPFLQQQMHGLRPTLLIIDESSYLDESHYEYIEEALEYYSNLVILYVGDKDQLPPVGSEEPHIFSIGLPTNCLITDHRFASDSQIAEITNALKENVRDKSYFLINVDTGKDITILDDTEFLDKMEELYTSREYQDDSFYVKSVAYRNITVDKMNKYIRGYYYDKPEYQPGERLLVNKPLSRKRRILANNGDIVTVISNEETEIEGVKGQLLTLSKKGVGSFKAIVTPHYRKKSQVRKELAKKEKWRELYNFMESFIEVKPIYASTIHKAQGASYVNVMLHLEDLVECKDHTLLARLLLVAVSRASKHVYVYGQVPEHLLRKN